MKVGRATHRRESREANVGHGSKPINNRWTKWAALRRRVCYVLKGWNQHAYPVSPIHILL
jgi:hypothetical protein